MSKKVIFIIFGFLGILLTIGIFLKDKALFLIKSDKQQTISPLGKEKTEKEPELQISLKEWQSSAGFAFLYPEDLQVNPIKDDQLNYAHLELTKTGREGKIEIICGDSQFANLEEWLKKDEEAKLGNALETEIASMSAKRVALSEGREIAALIDADQVIYKFVKEPTGEDYWNKVFKAILSTFKLIPLEGESQADFQQWLGDFDTSGADIIEALEVIE